MQQCDLFINKGQTKGHGVRHISQAEVREGIINKPSLCYFSSLQLFIAHSLATRVKYISSRIQNIYDSMLYISE